MSKRELASLNAVADVEGSRSKRRREAVDPQVTTSSDLDVPMSEPAEQSNGLPGIQSSQDIKEQGLKIWQTVRDAVNKEGRTISLDFLRKPSKRQYPDYYQLIKQPIALDDIKKQIENGGYTSLEALKQDFELCFNNAKQYNMKDSIIWKDAKDLLKVVHKTYSKLVPGYEDDSAPKAPSLNRLIKSRLQKLVDKTDEHGRVLSTEFMELPSKKEWAIYYKEIKKPQCLENIFKRIKRKEYHSAADFAADVELVFSNALTFNQDHTLIWEDALALRDFFRSLMSDLPPPHSLSQYSKTSTLIGAKIKIKPQGTAAVMQATATVTGASTISSPPLKAEPSPLLLKLPSSNVSKTPLPHNPPSLATIPSGGTANSTSSVISPNTAPSSNPAKTPMQSKLSPGKQATNAQSPAPTSYPQSYDPAGSQYPKHPVPLVKSFAGPPSSTPPAPNASLNVPPLTNNKTQSPGPSLGTHHLKSISIEIRPSERVVGLDHREGVKSWVMRLVRGETSILVKDVVLMGDEDDSTSEEDDEVERNGATDDAQVPSIENTIKNGRKKKGKTRTSGTRTGARRETRQSTKQKIEPAVDIQLKLNGVLVSEQPDKAGVWDFQIPAGSNSIEIGQTGSMSWKIYIDRRTEH